MKNCCMKYSANIEKIITVEDGTVVGGFGQRVLEFMNEHNYKAEIKILGIPDDLLNMALQKNFIMNVVMMHKLLKKLCWK